MGEKIKNIKNKIITKEELILILKQYKNKKIVWCNGCFDLFHVGHLNYLKNASNLGDILIVAVNSDESIKKYKGKDRPVQPEQERMENVAMLQVVDYVIKFDSIDTTQLLKEVKPDVFVVSDAIGENEKRESEIVRGYGGEIKVVPRTKFISTTEIIERIIN